MTIALQEYHGEKKSANHDSFLEKPENRGEITAFNIH